VGGIPLPPSLPYVFIFARCECASCLREERREVRDLINLSKSEMMFGWFSHHVNP
jgi:hypothetical protein